MTMSNNQRRKLKSASRFFAVQALFQMELSGQTVEAVTKEFIDFRFAEEFDDVEMQDGDPGMFRALVDGAVNNQAKIDQMTDRALVEKWPLGRIDSTLRALFRAAGAEFIAGETPPKVIIVEFVQIAEAFHPDSKEPKFVNAVLDHMAREARPEEF